MKAIWMRAAAAIFVLGVVGLVIGVLQVAKSPAPATRPAPGATPAQPGETTRSPRQEAARPMAHAAPTAEEIAATQQGGAVTAVLETDRGTIALELRGDLMPLTVSNFVKLAGAGYYDGLTFHRVEDWVVQGGDPTGTGRGGPGYAINLETHPELSNVRGAVAMARSQDPNSAGSQFYLLKTDAAWLDGQYAVFGMVTDGMAAVDGMAQGDKKLSVRINPE